jgi:hypothetical protein
MHFAAFTSSLLSPSSSSSALPYGSTVLRWLRLFQQFNSVFLSCALSNFSIFGSLLRVIGGFLHHDICGRFMMRALVFA